MDPSKMMNMMGGMDPKMMGSMMGGMGGGTAGGGGAPKVHAIGALPDAAPEQPPLPPLPPIPSQSRTEGRGQQDMRGASRSRSSSRGSRGSRRSPSYSAVRQPVAGTVAMGSGPPPNMVPQTMPGVSSEAIGTTLSSMLGTSSRKEVPVPSEDPSRAAARKAAASAAAAAFLQTASKVAETSRDAARDAATAKAAAPPMPFHQDDGDGGRRGGGYEGEAAGGGGGWTTTYHGSGMKPPVKLWLPEPSAREPEPYFAEAPPQPPPPGPAPVKRPSPVRRSRSRSKRRRKGGSRSPARRRRGRGWDDDEVPAAPPAPTPAPNLPVAQTVVAQPSRPAAPPGAQRPMRPPGMNVPVNRFGVPEATPEALAAAVFRAQQVEAAGLEAIRATGQIPRGPPDLPTGTEVIEQKCVAYLIGKGGQALAAINAAAGVSIQIDQSTKTFGWSMANIYGTEEGSAKAKMILRQKVSEYRPLRA
mmetsp:Transcript_55841/g.141407  ORF Transcript_55841/g.141407 Transcript_55841/m.141407 type:complete len:473 (-) Transcript_55841:218-1636(-)